MYLGIPQILMLLIIVMGGTITMVNHGKPRGDYNFWYWFISFAITLGLLWWGGFFS